MNIPIAGRRAIALEYDGNSAPRISAIGDGLLADQIIALAREHHVPLLENRELAALLAQLELGEEIPEALYRCVAQIIAFAYSLRARVPPGWSDHEEMRGSEVADGDVAPVALLPSSAASNRDAISSAGPDATPRR